MLVDIVSNVLDSEGSRNTISIFALVQRTAFTGDLLAASEFVGVPMTEDGDSFIVALEVGKGGTDVESAIVVTADGVVAMVVDESTYQIARIRISHTSKLHAVF